MFILLNEISERSFYLLAGLDDLLVQSVDAFFEDTHFAELVLASSVVVERR